MKASAVVGLLIFGLLLVSAVSPGLGMTTEAQPPEGMVLIPAGSFLMGDCLEEGDPDELPVHEVYVSAFYMDTYEVTKALWDEVATWAADHGYDIGPASGDGTAPDHPVHNVSWYEAVKWANARSEMEGLAPCYHTDDSFTGVYRTGQADILNEWVNWTAGGYRLPTEAEWEKAARGELVGARYPWGNDFDRTRANCDGYVGAATAVGSYAPNSFDLYDIAGNVYEWCWNRYASRSSDGADPRGPDLGARRASRGGSWASGPDGCRIANRLDLEPAYESSRLGLRLVRAAPQASTRVEALAVAHRSVGRRCGHGSWPTLEGRPPQLP